MNNICEVYTDDKINRKESKMSCSKMLIKNALDRVQKVVDKTNMFGAVCLYCNDLQNSIETHVAMFEEVLDAKDWLDSQKNLYDNKFDAFALFLLRKNEKPKLLFS